MKRKGHITAFYLETLLLILVFVAILLVLTSVFGMAKAQSSEAKLLTNAVTLAGNAAEAVSASDREDTLLALLNENENAETMKDTIGVTARYDTEMRPDPDGKLRLDVTCRRGSRRGPWCAVSSWSTGPISRNRSTGWTRRCF